MAWTAPRTWVVTELVTAALMNAQIRDNELYLKALMDIATGHDHAGGTDDGAPVAMLQSGLDAAKSATPDVGMVYVATDTALVYACYVDDAWVRVFPVHTHADAANGGGLDWDTCWADAVHSHLSNAEGGVLGLNLEEAFARAWARV